jgi:GNAT superfamily N-acetyltransferase
MTQLRPAEAEDATAIAKLATELGYPSTAGEVHSRLERLRSAGADAHAVFVAEREGGEVVGWLHVFAAARVESPPFAEIGGLVVGSEARGEGVGERLVRAAEEWARARGLSELRVRSNVVRTRAHGFYERVGFGQLKSQLVLVKRLG